MQIATDYFRKIFGISRKSDFWGDFHDITFAEDRFRRAVGHALYCVVFFLLLLTMLLSWVEGNLEMVLVLGGVGLCSMVAFIWLWCSEKYIYGPLGLLLGSLAILGVYLLLNDRSPAGSLFWFLLFPAMLMLCLGLRHGTIGFVCFYAFLLVVMTTPLHSHLKELLTVADRIRFMVAMLGAFAFSWFTEYFRFQTQHRLGLTMLRLEQDSLTDSLTGLGNRRSFYSYCKWLYDGSPGKPLMTSLAIVDIDHFKHINDTHGHDVGDQVLRDIAELLQAHSRASDKLYRWGGDEFLMLMPRTTAAEARLALERMRSAVEEMPSVMSSLNIPFTVSIGLYSGVMQTHLTPQINKADQNLYAAKTSGRNRVVG